MDDLGVEQLSKMSCKPKRVEPRTIFDRSNSSSDGQDDARGKEDDKEGKDDNEINKGSDKLCSNGETTCTSSNIVACQNRNVPRIISGCGDDDSDGKEKTDATPENLKKIDDIICGNYINEDDGLRYDELKIVEDVSPTKQSLAFTIDFGDDSTQSAAASAKYKNIMERFQNRHKRGASLSKIEDQSITAIPVTPQTPRTGRVMSSKQKKSEPLEANKVKLRIRERSVSGVRDTNKRHSWSPRSSTHESFDCAEKVQEKKMKNVCGNVNKTSVIAKESCAAGDIKNKINLDVDVSMKSLRNIKRAIAKEETPPPHFTPKSTAMQMALNKVEFICPEPPLEQKFCAEVDSVSEAGTYTLDGDNYTEEQKELMNIDKTVAMNPHEEGEMELVKDISQMRPNDLPLLSSTSENRRSNNVLEVSYYHDFTNVKPKISYLEKIKSRVKGITKSPDKKQNNVTDIGTFTSVTTCGVLSKKPMLDAHPKLNRKSSLTKSQIDSSEYISTENSLRSSGGTVYPSAFTDHQKAEYKLNLFTNSLDYSRESPVTPATPPLPDSPIDSYRVRTSETGLKSAQSKNDWIQEWARNARARSISATKEVNKQMSRSCDCQCNDSAFIDTRSYDVRGGMGRLCDNTMGEIEYSSDPNVSTRKWKTECVVTSRPPLSPSRIPSPMHSIGKGRNAIRTRGSLQDLSPLNTGAAETDVYLQKTAVAISNLAQSLSRKNSIHSCKSPPTPSVSDSPRHIYAQHYSADEYSPTHCHNELNGHNHNHGIHKRNLSLDYRSNNNNLMSQSLNNDLLSEIIEYRSQQRPRQNSFDASIDSPSRHRRRQGLIDQTEGSIKQQQQVQSPLRRSSSFSMKTLSTRNSMGGKNVAKVKHCVAASATVPTSKNAIQKSASSTSFRKMYSDYDENVAYYINDEDDLVDNYYSSDDYEEQGEFYESSGVQAEVETEREREREPEPLTNTRYNKALLMRIERSKQKVAEMSQSKQSGIAGVIACPNTPEMRRRSVHSAARSSMRQSVPRDSSLNRLRGEVPNSLASAKKQLLQSAANTVPSSNIKKVQPKYMDISKYKTAHGGNFLRKDESKSTLITKPEVKRSPSSASVVLNRSDPVRVSNRSVKSAGGRPGSSKRDSSVSKQKETELAMWKRRATYDPMKAAAEGRKRQEEAKKMTNLQQQHVQGKYTERPPKSPHRREL